MPRISKNLVGEQFGLLLAVKELDRAPGNHRMFEAVCTACGSIKVFYASSLRAVKNKGLPGCSCKKLASRIWSIDPDQTKSPMYNTWFGMISRCYSPKHVSFSRYGARGISVCESWHKFSNFCKWLADNGWCRGEVQVDRIDNDGGYSPENCRLVTPMENANNRSTNRVLVVGDEMVTIAHAARKFGVSESSIRRRFISNGDVNGYLRSLP